MTPGRKKLERNFWRNGLRPKLQAIPGMFFDRVETASTANSVPDVTYSYNGHHGWIELKAVESKDGTIDLSHYTPGQRRWLFDRGESAGYCWLMIRVDNTVYVVHWSNVRNIPTGPMLVKDLKEQSLFVWSGGVSTKDIKGHF